MTDLMGRILHFQLWEGSYKFNGRKNVMPINLYGKWTFVSFSDVQLVVGDGNNQITLKDQEAL